MERQIKLNENTINYVLKISTRARGIRIAIMPGGKIVVTKSKYSPEYFVNKFIQSKADWIIEKLISQKKFAPKRGKVELKKEYSKYKDQALEIVNQKLIFWNQFYNFSYNKVSVRNVSTRWGSCSSKKNLSFSYKVVFLNESELDYLIVHELCHLKEMNHGANFWKLVASQIPNYKEIRKNMKTNMY